jgi:hypothetical protein
MHLLKRSYPGKLIDSALKKVRRLDRTEILNHKKEPQDRTPLILTYHPQFDGLPKTCHQYDPILHSSERQKLSHKSPPLIGFRRPNNLGDMLVHAKIEKPNTSPGFHVGCGRKTCVVCDNNTIQRELDGQQIKQHLTCSSTNVIYQCWCDIHPNFNYIGQTSQTLKKRHYGHRSTVKNGNEKFGQHFHEPGHGVEAIKHLKIAAIERPRNKDPIYRRFKETQFIKKKMTITCGGNTYGDTIRLD